VSVSADTLVLAPDAEWDAEDQVAGILAEDAPIAADDAQAALMFAKSTIALPRALDWTELVAYARRKSTGDFEIPGNADRYNFYSVEVPLTTIVGDGQRLVRIRLELALTLGGVDSDDVVSFDLFPTTDTDVRTIASGEASLDIGEGLQFLLLATPAAALAPAAKSLGLKLSLPFKWTTQYATIQSSGRLSNPTMWYVTDEAIQSGFSPRVIIRALKGSAVGVSATLSGDLRERSALGTTLKAQFRTFSPRAYTLE
jgi:hypothetical protein